MDPQVQHSVNSEKIEHVLTAPISHKLKRKLRKKLQRQATRQKNARNREVDEPTGKDGKIAKLFIHGMLSIFEDKL